MIPRKPPYCDDIAVDGAALTLDCGAIVVAPGDDVAGSVTAAGGAGGNVFSLTSHPSWLSIDPQTGALIGTPPTGTFTIVAAVNDSTSATAQCTFTITVDAVSNDTLDIICPSVPDVLTECAGGQSLVTAQYTGTGALTFALSSNPAWMQVNPSTGEINYSPAPQGSAGTYSYTAQVTDGVLIGTCSGTIVVNENQPPVITNCPANLSWTQGLTVAFPFEVSDPEGSPVTWSASGLPDAVFLTPDGDLQGTPASLGNGTATITVDDNCGNQTSCTFNWDVTDDPCCPSVTPINDFCYDSQWAPGEDTGDCDKVWTLSVNNNCPAVGFAITVTPASPNIIADPLAGTITLKNGWMAPGDHVITYRAISSNGTTCNAESFTIRSTCPTQAGMNSSFQTYWSAERPFIDQMKLAGYDRDGVTAAESAGWPADANGWGTEVGPTFTSYFYTNDQAASTVGDQENYLASTCWRVIWDGTGNVMVAGFNLVANAAPVPGLTNEIEFTLLHNQIGNARVVWENTVANDHVRNIRIVPCEYAADYRNFNWANFDCSNKANNPPIFDPCWLDHVAYGETYRFMVAWQTSEWRSFETSPSGDHSQWMNSPGDANFYDNTFSGVPNDPARYGIRGMSWPPELVACFAIQSGVTPHINFECSAWENLNAGDTYVQQFAQRICACGYSGHIKVEYANEGWNQSGPFSTHNDYLKNALHPAANGLAADSQQRAAVNYAAMSNDIRDAFAAAYCKPHNVRGVFNAQHYNMGWFNDALATIDTPNFVIETGPYYSNDVALNQGSPLYDAIVAHFAGGQDQGALNTNLLAEIMDSSWIGAGTAAPKHDMVHLCDQMTDYAAAAHSAGMSYGAYEAGLHFNAFGFGAGHSLSGNDVIVRDAIHAFLESSEAAQADQALLDCAKATCAGTIAFYSMSTTNNFKTWSYFDHNCADVTPRAAQIKSFNESREACPAGWDSNGA